VDITSRTEFEDRGRVDLYGGSWDTLSSSLEAGGRVGRTQYFVTARELQSSQGLENAVSAPNPIHDATTQGKFFAYASTLLGDGARVTAMGGGFFGDFQIPDQGSAPDLDERETDSFLFALAALQTHNDRTDTQVSLYTRGAGVEFVPDIAGDLAQNNGVASRVTRQSQLSGLQADAALRLGGSHTLRAGLEASVEQTLLDDQSTVQPLDVNGNPLTATPETLDDRNAKTGWGAGGYVQEEWALSPQWSLNTGLRFDAMGQYVSAHQLSPRIALLYKNQFGTQAHAGISNYFTPPMQAQAAPNNLALFQGTTQQAPDLQESPVKPERATYYDVGAEQGFAGGFSAGIDAYYKMSTDTLDDGQFGQAVVLDQYNWAYGCSKGVECKLSREAGGLRLYANASWELTEVEEVVSNEYLFADPDELSYLDSHFCSSSDAQTLSASWGGSWRWRSLLVSVDGLYGSGLAEGFANQQHLPGYSPWNAALAWSLPLWSAKRATQLRLTVNNLFDLSYELRSGDGVGEFAPQYGPRRAEFLELSQAF
jgi:outer membrane receptor for ferrienterochelin and colicin